MAKDGPWLSVVATGPGERGGGRLAPQEQQLVASRSRATAPGEEGAESKKTGNSRMAFPENFGRGTLTRGIGGKVWIKHKLEFFVGNFQPLTRGAIL